MSASRWSPRRAILSIGARAQAVETSAITNPRAFHRMFWAYLGKGLLLIILFTLLMPAPEGATFVVRLCLSTLVFSVSFVAASSARRAAMAYFNGYIDGQSATVASLTEAARRDMDIGQWAQAERERQIVSLVQRMNPQREGWPFER